MPDLEEFIDVLLSARRKLRDSFSRLHDKILELVGNDATCKRLMTIPGVGPVTALAFISNIDIPARSEAPDRSARPWG